MFHSLNTRVFNHGKALSFKSILVLILGAIYSALMWSL